MAPTMEERQKRGKKVVCKPRVFKLVSPDFKYATWNGREYKIKKDQFGYYKIWCFGKLPPKLRGKYQSEKLAEQDLIRFLVDTDHPAGRAIYPGCPEQRRINFITHLSVD